MKRKQLILIALLSIHFRPYAQTNRSTQDSIKVILSDSLVSLNLIEGDSTKRPISINNLGLNNLTISTRLTNSSFENETSSPYLGTPLMFKIDDNIIEARNPDTGRRVPEWAVNLPDSYNNYSDAGLTFDGRFLYMKGIQNGFIYKVDPLIDAIVDTSYIAALEGKSVVGLAHSGKFLYASLNSEDLVLKINFETGEILDQIQIDNLGLGLAFGGNRGTLFTLLDSDEIAEINIITGEVINTILDDDFTSAGLAFSKRLGVIFSDYGYYENVGYDPDTGLAIKFIDQWGNSLAGDGTFGLEWLDLESVTFTLDTGESKQLNLSFNASSLEPGHYRTTIQYSINDVDKTVIDLPVELNILPTTKRISAASFCTVESNGESIWKIQNPNDFTVNATWNILNSDLTDNIQLQPGENVLYSGMTENVNNTLQVEWPDERGVIQSTLSTSNNVICNLRGLTLVATCSENRSKLRNWEISNPNLFPVEVDWQIIGSEQGGALVAESGTTPFSTLVDFADETYTLQILWYTEEGQAKRQRKQSLKTPCDLRGLTLTSVCTDDPNGRKKWQIFNPNNFSVEAAWEMEGSDLTDTLDVPTDISFFYSATQPENHIVKLIWADEEGNIKRQRKSADFGSCVELNTFSHVRIESDMNDSDIGETKFRIYPNPFDNNIIINALSDRVTKDSWSLKIYNSKGSKVHELNSENIGTLYDVEINTSNFPNGTYFVIFNMNKRREKVIIIKR